MSNLFITVNYQVEQRYGLTSFEDYKNMTELCVESFTKNLIGLDDIFVLEGKVDNYHQLFKEVYARVKKIYHSKGNHNILFADSDTICLKPVDVFEKFDKFAMFLIANEFQFSFANPVCLDLVKNLSPWMMANLRYYPNSMDQKLWDIGDDLAYSWINEWAYDTIIYNKMFHAQDIADYNVYNIPKWNTLVVGGITDSHIKNSDIIHCAATRGSSLALENINKALGRR